MKINLVRKIDDYVGVLGLAIDDKQSTVILFDSSNIRKVFLNNKTVGDKLIKLSFESFDVEEVIDSLFEAFGRGEVEVREDCLTVHLKLIDRAKTRVEFEYDQLIDRTTDEYSDICLKLIEAGIKGRKIDEIVLARKRKRLDKEINMKVSKRCLVSHRGKREKISKGLNKLN